ncbi:hypothetical protein FAM09_27715 [Niastella caeni]|uniref:Uncharacterized protein n=1 Tax=Niastella caeni TaxID=2569763 RepID=A0A4S8HBB5_9BACT|nr:hypothetical protein [Niastella caeni]THU31975.1 hypothetical protein FAM09_27715 [Niastella caeni]
MVETGGSIFIALPLVVMLLSLLPVCTLFVRKVAVSAILNVLRILCLFVFLQYLTLYFIQPGSPALYTSCKLVEFTLVFYLFKLMIPSGQGKDIMNMFLVSFLSVVITIYSLKGIMAFPGIMTVVQAAILTLLAFVVLFQVISNRHIVLINEPAFWVAGGLLCYFGMVVFMEAIAGYQSGLSQQIQQQKSIIIMFADIMRMIIFVVAVSVAGKQPIDNRQ